MSTEKIEPLATFEGVLYSGEAALVDGKPVVFDLSTATVPAETVLMFNHTQTIGKARPVIKGNQILIEGGEVYGYCDQAIEVANYGKAKIPYQMSAGFMMLNADIEKIEKGSMIVNGRTFTAPFTLARNAKLSEATICAVGRDTNTATIFLSADPQTDCVIKIDPMEGESMNVDGIKSELEKAKAELIERDARLEALESTIAEMKLSATVLQRKNVLKGLLADDKLNDAEFTVELGALPSKIFEFFVENLPKQEAGNKDALRGVIEALNLNLSAASGEKLTAKEEAEAIYRKMGGV